MFAQDIERLILPSFFCELSSVSSPYPRLPPPFLVILQSGLLPNSKEHNPPQALQSCGQKEQSKGETYPNFIIAAPVVTSTKYWHTSRYAVP